MTWPFPTGRLPENWSVGVFSLKQFEQLYVLRPGKELSEVVEILCDIIIKVALVRGTAFCIIKMANLTVKQSGTVSAAEICALTGAFRIRNKSLLSLGIHSNIQFYHGAFFGLY